MNADSPAGFPVSDVPAWKELQGHASRLEGAHLRELFGEEPERVERMTLETVGLFVDFSKHLIDADAMNSLFDLARQVGLAERIEAMFTGEKINVSEGRSVLHTALRLPRDSVLVVDGVDVVAEVHSVLDRMAGLAEEVRSGRWVGAGGTSIRNVVNIGIGGSDLGPMMAHEALRAYAQPGLTFRFVSNVDPTAFAEATRDLNPEETLFIVSSKSFTTQETMMNAALARAWIVEKLGEKAVARHFVAVSTNSEGVAEFGIDPDHMFEFWDWVGGRYSMTSAIGLSTMIAIGPEAFRAMLAGFHAIDEHFRTTPLQENIPVIMGLLAVWYRNFLGCQTVGVMPYEQYLHRLPAYLQQLTMESNGKSVTLGGAPVSWNTGSVYWGEPGTNGQHSFFQLLHQGTVLVPVDLIGFRRSLNEPRAQHDFLIANLLAQARALAFGKTESEVRAEGSAPELVPHRVMPGNRPSTVILGDVLDPFSLGALVALYEHSVLTQGTVWGIDSFDQWGVELGKVLATEIAPLLDSDDEPGYDASTNALIRRYRCARDTEESH
jgi:glucose-6-phosphate isomerase